jgi:TolA-binding protein
MLFTLAAVLTAQGQFKLYEKGVDNYKEGKYPEAIDYFSQYLTKGTRDKSIDVEVFYLRALSFYKTESYVRAVEDFQESLLLNHPNKGNIYWFMAKATVKVGNNEDALTQYNNAIRELSFIDKNSRAKLLYERSQIYTKSGDLVSAYQDLKQARELNPTVTEVNAEFDKLNKNEAITRSAEKRITDLQTQKKSEPAPDLAKDQGASKQKEPVRPQTGNAKPKNAETVKTEEVKKPEVKTEPPAVIEPAQPTLADIYKDEKRYALVIGNSNYPKAIGLLKNPVNDATDVAMELEKSNFQVQLITNATYGQMRAAMLKFKEKVDAGDKEKTVALFYYAGHGLAHDDENFLVPIDASIEFEDDIARYCFPVQRMVLSNMERSNSRMNIVILDACRNNPFPSMTRSAGQQGLGEMKRGRGSFIAYATAPGSVASDGNGRNGLYTQELLKSLRKPGLTIEQVFKDVRVNVLKLSGEKQFTWDSSNIIGEFYFKF